MTKTADLFAAPMLPYKVGLKHEENSTPKESESHDNLDHVFYVIDGKTTFRVGGELDKARETAPGEWRAPAIVGKVKEIEIGKGDLLVIPRGTPHYHSNKGGKVTILSIAVLPAARPDENTRHEQTLRAE